MYLLPKRPAWFLLALVVSSYAFAYVLPGGAILRHLAKNREELHLTALRAEGTVSFFGAAVTEAGAALGAPTDKPELQADAVFSVRFPSRCRLDVSTTEGGRAAVVDVMGRFKNDGAVVQALNTAVDQVCRLLATRGGNDFEVRGELDRYLRELGIETQLTSLDRQGDQVVYVLGKPVAGAPQFWIFKDSFLPARLRYWDGAKVPWEVRFVDYNSPSAGEMFPRIVEVIRQGERLMRFTLLKADNHAILPDRLFASAQ
jgi:hypothetical protein